jgi:hypothetical protein
MPNVLARLNTRDGCSLQLLTDKEKIQIGYRVSYANFGASDELNQGEWKEGSLVPLKLL